MINLEIDHEIINTATTWESEGEKLALAIVVKLQIFSQATWKHDANKEDGHIIGSVSGGCVEGAVIVGSKNILQSNKAELMEFGVADEDAWSVGLSCGGRITVFVCPGKIESGLFQKLLKLKKIDQTYLLSVILLKEQSEL